MDGHDEHEKDEQVDDGGLPHIEVQKNENDGASNDRTFVILSDDNSIADDVDGQIMIEQDRIQTINQSCQSEKQEYVQ